MGFNIQGPKMVISKGIFCKLLGLSSGEGYSNPKSIMSANIISAYHQIGYNGVLIVLSNFKKLYLPIVWNALFSILFKCFFEQNIGSDSASKLFHTLMYGLYTDEKIDLGHILWAQFVQIPNSSMKDTDISCVLF